MASPPVPSSSTYTLWAYDRPLLVPSDQARYENVLLDAKPHSDGGWVVIRTEGPRRWPVDPTSYGPLIPSPWGRLLRLNASGRIVAEEHAAEPLGLTRVDVFENAGVVVAQGRQVRNGTVHSLRIDTLDGIASELTNCASIGDRCWSYRTASYQGSTALQERDPRDLALIRTYPHLTMDGLYQHTPPAIWPALNFIAWRPPGANAHVRVEPLDPSRPILVPWLELLRAACGVTRMVDDRAYVEYGPPDCDGAEAGWSGQLVVVSTGRVLRRFGTDDVISGNELAAGRLVLWPTLLAIDPGTARPGPFLPDHAISIDFERGIAVVPLTNGGAAVLRRYERRADLRSLELSTVSSGRCAEIEFPRLLLGPADLICSGRMQTVRNGELLLATGRNYRTPTDFEVVRITADEASRQIEIVYRSQGSAPRPLESSPFRVIELPHPPTGEWLVRVMSEGSGASPLTSSTFVVRFP